MSNNQEALIKCENAPEHFVTVKQDILLKCIFKLIDVDNSGDISRAELIKAMRKDKDLGIISLS